MLQDFLKLCLHLEPEWNRTRQPGIVENRIKPPGIRELPLIDTQRSVR